MSDELSSRIDALSQMVLDAMQREASLRTQLVVANGEIATLKKQIDSADSSKDTNS